MTTPVLRRVTRREMHSPRTTAMVVAVVLVLLAVVYLGIELVLVLAGQPPLLVAPDDMAAWLVALPTLAPPAAIIAGSAAVGVVGLVFIVLALAPGRLAKHRMQDAERAVIVDNGVVASSLAQHLSDETGVARHDITVGVGHRTADVTVRESAGVPVDRDLVRRLVTDELDAYALSPAVRPRVRVITPKDSEQPR